MTAPTREQMNHWALDCGLIDQRDVDNGVVDVLFDDLQRFSEIDLRRFAALAYAAGQTAEREACAKACDTLSNADKNSLPMPKFPESVKNRYRVEVENDKT